LRIKVTLILLATLTASSAHAAWTDFAPKPFENGAYIELFGSEERDRSDNSGRKYGWNDTFFTEKLTVFSNGYVYHPRFLQYQLSLSGALKQEDYSQSYAPSAGWTHDTGLDYLARFLFLPEHPYDFELFAIRREPLYKSQSSTQHSNVETSNGARFRYRRKPFFAHVGLIDNTTSSNTSSTNVRRLNVDGEYFKEFGHGSVFTVTAFFIPSTFTGDFGLSGETTQYGVTSLIDVHTVRLNLTATQSGYDQESPRSGQIENDQFAFQERLSAFLPANFTADFYYRVLNNESTTSNLVATEPRTLKDDLTDLEAVISNRLYHSLDSRYTFLRSTRTSSGGDSTAVSNTLGVDYNKLIPHGRVLAGVYFGTIDTDSTGRTDVPSEPHPGILVPAPGTFSLDQPNVDPDSLVVYLRSPLPPFEAIRLFETTNYTVTLVANRLQIQVFLLPPQFTLPGTFDFFASYSLTTGTFELRMNSFGFNTSVQLLDDMLTPYYRYLAVRSNVLSGTFPGIPVDSTQNTIGLAFLDGPWRAVGEFQSLDWAVSPYRLLRGEVQFTGSIDPTFRAYATADYLYKNFPQGSSINSPGAYSDTSVSLSGSLQKDFLARTLMLSVGGSYGRVIGPVDSSAFTLNSSLTWRVGKFELVAGGDTFASNADAAMNSQYNRSHHYYYVRVRRRLF